MKKRMPFRNAFPSFLVALLALNTFGIYILPNNIEAAGNPDLDWVKDIGDSGFEEGYDVAIDSSGNTYYAGDLGGTIDFDEDNVIAGDTHTSAGGSDIAVAKYNSSGVLQWVNAVGSTGTDRAHGIGVDSTGNVYVTGIFSGTVDFDENNVISGDTQTSAGGGDIFIVKYNTSGVLQWSKGLGTAVSGNDIGYGLEVDSSANVYVTGFYHSSVDFDEDNVVAGDSLTGFGSDDSFLAKYDTNGTIQWVKAIAGTGGDQGYNVAIDSSGNVYAAGKFDSPSVDFDRDNVVSGDTLSGEGGYLAKYNSSGVLQWVKGVITLSPGTGLFRDVEVDSSGNVFGAGQYQGTSIDFDTDNVVSGDTRTSTFIDPFVVKYNSSGVIQWLQTINDSGGSGGAFGLGLDSSGDVYASGNHSGAPSTDYDSLNVTVGDTTTVINGMFLVKYAGSNGTMQWLNIISAGGGSRINEVIEDAGDIYVSGKYSGTVDFDSENTISGDTLVATNFQDGFVAKYNPDTPTAITNIDGGILEGVNLSTLSDVTISSELNNGSMIPVRIQLTTGSIPIADISVDITTDRDWGSALVGGSDIGTGKAFVHNLTTRAGAAADYTLYVPKLPAQSQVRICPGATNLSEVNTSCASGVDLPLGTTGQYTVTIENIGGQDYWAIAGVTGTGGLGTGSINTTFIDLDPQPATAPSTISNAPEVAVSTTDQFYLSYIPSTTEFAAADYVDIVIPQDWSGLAACAGTGDADGIGGADHTVALFNSQIIRYTFTGATTTALTTGVEFCFEAQTPAAPGNYSIAVSDINDGDFSAALIYVGDANDVTITATVPATISLRIKEPTTTTDTNICELGVLNPASVNSCSYRIAAGTNSATGLEVFVLADDQLNTAGDTADIDDVAGGGVVTAGNEEHGILVTLGTGYTIGGAFSETTDELVPLVQTLILDAAAAVSDSDTATWSTITHSASVNSSSLAGAYDQIIIYRAWVGT